MPFCVVWAFLTQEASPGPVFLCQNGQIGDVAIIESHPFLHFGLGIREARLRILTSFLSLHTSKTQSKLLGSFSQPLSSPHLSCSEDAGTGRGTREELMRSQSHRGASTPLRSELSTLRAYYGGPDAVSEQPCRTVMMRHWATHVHGSARAHT